MTALGHTLHQFMSRMINGLLDATSICSTAKCYNDTKSPCSRVYLQCTCSDSRPYHEVPTAHTCMMYVKASSCSAHPWSVTYLSPAASRKVLRVSAYRLQRCSTCSTVSSSPPCPHAGLSASFFLKKRSTHSALSELAPG